MATTTRHQRAVRREENLARAAARKADRVRRRQAIREGLASWKAALQQERARRPSMAEAAAAGLPITFMARGGTRLVFRFGEEARDPDGITFRPAASVDRVTPDGNIRHLIPLATEGE